jgi:hypothetical protein
VEDKLTRTRFIAAVSAATCGAALLGVAPAAAQQRQLPSLQQAYPQESYTQYRYRGGYRYDRPRYSRYYDRSYRRGDGIAAGVAGLAAGALIGGAIASAQQPVYAAPPPPYAVARGGDADWIAYCSQRYRSFDPASGTYLGYDGQRHMCQ